MTNPPRAYINAGGTHPRMSRFEIWISRRWSAHTGRYYRIVNARKRSCAIVTLTPHNTLVFAQFKTASWRSLFLSPRVIDALREYAVNVPRDA